MDKWVVTIFFASILVGCVTVTEQNFGSSFNHIAAADARVALGISYLNVGDRLKARENLELAIKYAPNYYKALNSIAYYYQLVGETKLAEQAFKKAIWESPKNGELLNNYGAFLCRQGQYEKADKYFNRAIEQLSNYHIVDSLENAAICSLKSGYRTEAEYYFERSLDYEPNRYFSLLQLIKLKLDNGDYNEARLRLVKYHKKFGYQSGSLSLLIKVEERAGNKELAEQYAIVLKNRYLNSTKN